MSQASPLGRLGNKLEGLQLSPQDIMEFIFFPVVNEGCRVIAEGIVDKPADLDVATVMAMGFPPWRSVPSSTIPCLQAASARSAHSATVLFVGLVSHSGKPHGIRALAITIGSCRIFLFPNGCRWRVVLVCAGVLVLGNHSSCRISLHPNGCVLRVAHLCAGVYW